MAWFESHLAEHEFVGIKQVSITVPDSSRVCVLDQKGVWCSRGTGTHPVMVPLLANARQLAISVNNACALSESGLQCESPSYNLPYSPNSFGTATEIQSGAYRFCALKEGNVVCWGRGNWTHDGRREFVIPTGIQNPKKLSVSRIDYRAEFGKSLEGACVIDDLGVICWGDPEFERIPRELHFKDPRAVAVGAHHACVMDGSSDVVCWGNNRYGQTQPPSRFKKLRALASGATHTCALDSDGIRCWGDQANGATQVPTDEWTNQ